MDVATRRVHALSQNCRFTLPLLDGSLTLTEMWDFHYEHNPSHVVFVHSNAFGEQIKLLYSDVVPAIHRAARFAANLVGVDLDAGPATLPAIAILASSDTITYITTVLGLLRAGITAVLIAPRCSTPAVVSLLSETRPSYILVSRDSPTHDLAESSLAQLKLTNPKLAPPEMCLMPTIDHLHVKDVLFTPVSPVKRDPRLILHSSGSTSLPKPISWSDRMFLQIMTQLNFATQDMCGQVFAAHGLAMFHSASWAFVSWIPAVGLALATFEPISPATVPSPDAVFQGFTKSGASWGFAVPSFVEQWSVDEAKVEQLRCLTGLIYGGGPLNKHAGDLLVKNDVKLHTLYGTTEVGGITIPFYDCLGLDWEYFAIDPNLGANLIPIGDGTYELVIVAKPDREIAVINAKFQNKDAYSISDLLVPHPSKSGLWRVIGRTDDQITLSTGEKTNPAPLESILSQDPHVAAAVMFGRGRSQVGVIVELKEEFAFDPSDENKLVELRNQLRPKVEESNAIAPAYSRLFKEMILASNPSKPFPYTGKGTVRKAKVIEDYGPEIEALYNALEEMTQIQPPEVWNSESSSQLVNSVVEEVLKRAIHETEDIFEAGCDSLQATWIQNSLTHALRKTPGVLLDHISPGFVYGHPTIASLSQYLLTVVYGGAEATGRPRRAELIAYVDRYTTSFPKHISSSPTSDQEVILITGTTGALGSAVLASLVATESVQKIFALNRPSPKEIIERQKEALKSRGSDPEIALSSKVTLIEGQLDGSGLGVDSVLQDEIRRTVTHIIHIAWRVDFNLSLASFANALTGIRTLVDFALSSPQPHPPRFLFTSSIGALRNLKSQSAVEETLIEDPSVPVGQGYGESKWVAERVLGSAAEATPLKPTILRIGQICGSKNGSWNTSDWLPSVIKSSLALGCLPEFKGVCSWIPLELAAQTLVDMRNEQLLTINLVHPQPVDCKDLFNIFSQELSLPLVPYAEWESKLEKAVAEASDTNNSLRIAEFGDRIPATMLLSFFRDVLRAEEAVVFSKDEDQEALGFPRLVVENARNVSESFRSATKLGADDVRSWLKYWKNVGFIMY